MSSRSRQRQACIENGGLDNKPPCYVAILFLILSCLKDFHLDSNCGETGFQESIKQHIPLKSVRLDQFILLGLTVA